MSEFKVNYFSMDSLYYQPLSKEIDNEKFKKMFIKCQKIRLTDILLAALNLTIDKESIIYYQKSIEINFRIISNTLTSHLLEMCDIKKQKIKKIYFANLKSFFELSLAIPILKLEMNSNNYTKASNYNNNKLIESDIHIKENANKLFFNNQFEEALDEYLNIYQRSRSDLTINLPISFIYLFIKNEYKKGLEYLKKAKKFAKIDKNIHIENFITFFLAIADYLNNNLLEAENNLNILLKKQYDDSLPNALININLNETKFLLALIKIKNNKQEAAFDLLKEIFVQDELYIEKAYFDINFIEIKSKIKQYINTETKKLKNSFITVYEDDYKKLKSSYKNTKNYLKKYLKEKFFNIENEFNIVKKAQEAFLLKIKPNIISIEEFSSEIDAFSNNIEFLTSEINGLESKVDSILESYQKIIGKRKKEIILNYPNQVKGYLERNTYVDSEDFNKLINKYSDILCKESDLLYEKNKLFKKCNNISNKITTTKDFFKYNYYSKEAADLRDLEEDLARIKRNISLTYNQDYYSDNAQKTEYDEDEYKDDIKNINNIINNMLNDIKAKHRKKVLKNNEEYKVSEFSTSVIFILSLIIYFSWEIKYVDGFWNGCGMIFLNIIFLAIYHTIRTEQKETKRRKIVKENQAAIFEINNILKD